MSCVSFSIIPTLNSLCNIFVNCNLTIFSTELVLIECKLGRHPVTVSSLLLGFRRIDYAEWVLCSQMREEVYASLACIVTSQPWSALQGVSKVNKLKLRLLYVWAGLILQPSRHFTYVTTHSPTIPSLYLRHNSFSNPSVALPTSQFILQPFFRFSYVTNSSLNSPGEPPMYLGSEIMF